MHIKEYIKKIDFKNPILLVSCLIVSSIVIGLGFYITIFSELILPIIVTFILTTAIFLVILYLSYTEKIKMEKVFLFTALSLGILFMITMVPFAEPDGFDHYFASLKASNILMFRFDSLNQAETGYFDLSDFSEHVNVSCGYERVLSELFTPFESEGFSEIEYVLTYPIQYIPQAVGMTIARILNLNMMWVFYLGRFCNLLFYVACGYMAIKRIPKFKTMLFIVALLPMSIHQAASYSYDAFTNALCLVMVAYIFSMIFEKGIIEKSDWIVVLVSSALVAPTKVVYSMILILLFMIPKERFESKKKRITIISIVIACSVLAILMIKLSLIISVQGSNLGETWHGGENYDLAYIFEDPIDTITIFMRTIKESAKFFVYSCVGYVLGGLSLYINTKIILAYLFILLLSMIDVKGEKFEVKMSVRILSLVISIGVFLAVMLSMFLSWTPNTSGRILGIQGRYFLPVVPLVCLGFKTKFLTLEKNIDKHLIFMVIFLGACTISNILSYTIAH